MSRRSRAGSRAERSPDTVPGDSGATPSPGAAPASATASPGSLAALVALGALAALWAGFLWSELVRAREGARPFCPIGDEAGCAAVWDSAFASAVHRLTGVPIAGWGLVWGLVALALPLLALARRAEGRPHEALVSAARITAGAGLVTVFAMVGVSAAERAFCFGCSVTYLVVAGYAGIALFGWQRLGLPEPGRGLALAATATLVAFLALLYPGTRTPRAPGEAAREAVEKAAVASRGAVPEQAASQAPESARLPPGSRSAPADAQLLEFVSSLAPELKQGLSDSLFIYASSATVPLPAPRTLLGSADAPVRITGFTDVLCDHCAQLHDTLESLRRHLPEGSFAVAPREFPLDGSCNPVLPARGPESVRCVAARARVCLEGHPRASEFAGALYRHQKGLSPERVLELAAPYKGRAEMEACMASPATRGRLEEDAILGSRFDADGTPIVAVNGKKGTSFGPFLYAIVLARGDAGHPAFRGLPAPNPQAHIH